MTEEAPGNPTDDREQEAEAGFSLIEMLIATVVTVFFMTAAYSVSQYMQDIGFRSQLRANTQQGSRLAVERMQQIIRMAGVNPSGRAFGSGVLPFPQATATTLRVLMDLPQDENNNGNTWDVIDGNNDNDTTDDGENENGDGFLNDEGEDITFTYDPVAGTLTYDDNNTGATGIIATGIVPNPGGQPLFAYVRDPVSNAPQRVILTVTLASARDDLITSAPVTYSLSTSIGARLESVPDLGFVAQAPENKKEKVKK